MIWSSQEDYHSVYYFQDCKDCRVRLCIYVFNKYRKMPQTSNQGLALKASKIPRVIDIN